ncbi:MAG: PPOX class F420-dependent oxidoreductase [Chloroflexota bacterium]|nr:PPOX class F420-dependent oxidoreductase [Dehalococcoidia bacterium]MDW8253330.1 PPOX class F420-dependent oxidoreductase [Chloroflexota bacterium]
MTEQQPVFPNLGASPYLSLTTFRRSGEPVATPVWFAREGDRLVLLTRAGAGKLKRIAHTPRVLVAPCDVRGRVTGETAEGRARLLPPEQAEAARKAILKKYGLLGWLFVTLERMRRSSQTVYFEIRPLKDE